MPYLCLPKRKWPFPHPSVGKKKKKKKKLIRLRTYRLWRWPGEPSFGAGSERTLRAHALHKQSTAGPRDRRIAAVAAKKKTSKKKHNANKQHGNSLMCKTDLSPFLPNTSSVESQAQRSTKRSVVHKSPTVLPRKSWRACSFGRKRKARMNEGPR